MWEYASVSEGPARTLLRHARRRQPEQPAVALKVLLMLEPPRKVDRADLRILPCDLLKVAEPPSVEVDNPQILTPPNHTSIAAALASSALASSRHDHVLGGQPRRDRSIAQQRAHSASLSPVAPTGHPLSGQLWAE